MSLESECLTWAKVTSRRYKQAKRCDNVSTNITKRALELPVRVCSESAIITEPYKDLAHFHDLYIMNPLGQHMNADSIDSLHALCFRFFSDSTLTILKTTWAA